MAIRAASTRRITASSAQSGDAVVIYSGTTGTYTVGGSASSSVSAGSGTTISTIVYTDQNYNTLTANAASTTFGYVRILGSGFTTGANVFLSNTSTNILSNITANTAFVNGGEIRANVPSISVGNYTLYVFNSSGSSAIYYSGMTFEPYPIWSTPSSLNSTTVAVNIPLAGYVTSTSGVQPITFGLASGNTLPSGLTLSSSGVISGTTSITGGSQTFYIYITATDLYNETTTSGNIALTLTSTDPQFNVTTMLLNSETPVTSFITDASVIDTAVTIVGNTKPTLTTPYLGDGYYSNYLNSTSTSAGSSLSGTLSTTIGNSNFTIEGWVYHTTLYNYMTWFAITRGTTGFNVGSDSTGAVVIYYNSARQIASTSIPITAGTWYHFAFVRNGTTITAYINGTNVGSTTTTTNSNFTASGFFIGSLDNTQEFVPGYINNLRLVVGTAVYTTNFTPPTAPLTAITNTVLLTCQSSSFVDKGPNNLAITKTGTPAISSANPFAFVSSLSNLGTTYFSGTSDYLIATSGSQFAFGTSNYTVEMWVYPTVAGKAMCLFDTRTTSASTSGVALAINATNQPYVYVNATTLFTSSTALTLNAWTHVAMVKNSGTIALYMNGVQVGSASSATSCTDTFCTIATTIDFRDATTTYKFTGYLSDVRVVNGTAVYTTNFTSPTTILTAVANTGLLTLQYNGGANNGGVIDNSPFNNTISRTGSQGTFSPYSQMGWSILFNGSTDYLALPTSSAFALSTGNFTAECWFYTTAFATFQSFIDFWPNTSGTYIVGQWQLGTDNANHLTWTVATSTISAGNQTLTASTTFTINTWNHAAIVRNGTAVTLYLNGVSVASTTFSGTVGYSSAGGSLGRQTTGSLYLTGYLSNARLTNTAVYTTAFTPSTSPLTAVSGTVLLACQSNRFKDNSTNNFTLTPSGTPITQAFTPFAPSAAYSLTNNGGSCYFNGTTDYLTIASTTTLQGLASRNMTIEFWIYFSNAWSTTSYNPVQKGRTGTTDYEWGVYLTGSGSNAGVISWQPNSGTGGALNTYNSSSINIYAGTWNHIAISVSSTTVYFFLNGVAAGTATVALQTFTSTGALSIANNNIGTNTYFAGYMSDVRITPGAALYTTGFTPSTTPLTSYTISTPSTLLLNMNNGGIVDQHGSFDIATLGNAQMSTSTVKFGAGSLRFTGTSGAYLQSVQTLPALTWWIGSFTIEYWIYANAFSQGSNSESTAIGNMTGASTTTYWSFGPITAGTVRWYYNNGSAQNLTTSATLSTGQWYHLAFVNNAGSLAIYINGVSSATGSISGTPQAAAATPLTIGSSNNVVFNGYLDEVRITKYARYTGNFTPPTIGSIAQ